MSEDFPMLSDDALCRALRAKTYSVQNYDNNTYTNGQLMSINIPSLPILWLPRGGWHSWVLTVNYTWSGWTTNAGQGACIGIGQNFPFCSMLNINVVSSNGQSVSYQQQFNKFYIARYLLKGVDKHTDDMSMMAINPGWLPYAQPNSNVGTSGTDIARRTPFNIGQYQTNSTNFVWATNSNNLRPNTTNSIVYTVNFNFDFTPILSLDAVIDLASMASQTRSAMKLEIQLDQQSNWLGTSVTGTNVGTLVINSFNIQPTMYMCQLVPTNELRIVIARLINSNSFLIPIESFYTQTASVTTGLGQLQQRIYIDEEDCTDIMVCHQLPTAFQAQDPLTVDSSGWDTTNLFTNANMISLQFQSGGSYFPANGPITRALALCGSVVSGYNGQLNVNDGINFFRMFLNIKSDTGSKFGTFITPQYYHSVNPSTSYDFVAGYSFETLCTGLYSGYNVRENSGSIDINITYSSSSGQLAPACQMYAFSSYRRVYVLTVGGLLYITKPQCIAKLAEMDPRAEELLNKLLHISGYM